ncbi:MAG: ABC transporter ATP-binding protein [Nitrospirae bacterium]|nr:ABC transporter ATP-binding protein [Nitrospirota bacterium]
MLELIDVEAHYGNIRALKGVNISLSEGEIVTLIGANGAGKTTTLMAVSGIVPASAGEILFMGKPIHELTPDRIASLGISQVPEGRHIFQRMSVMENLHMGAFTRRDRKEIKRDLEYVFELFPVLTERRHQQGGTLSGGEQQMLAISRALMARPKLLLLDEPSLGLAPKIVKQIFEIIRKINREHNTTVFIVEQNANLALQTADRGYVMENGSVVLSDECSKLISNDKVREAYLGI